MATDIELIIRREHVRPDQFSNVTEIFKKAPTQFEEFGNTRSATIGELIENIQKKYVVLVQKD
jgi:hypothetical protein